MHSRASKLAVVVLGAMFTASMCYANSIYMGPMPPPTGKKSIYMGPMPPPTGKSSIYMGPMPPPTGKNVS